MSDWDVEKTEPLGEWDVVSQEPEAPAPQQAAPRSLGDDLGRQVGLTARAGVTGALAAPNTAADGLVPQVRQCKGFSAPLACR
jgi:hypothetical protein